MTDCCSTPGLLPVDEALARLLAAAQPVTETENVALLATAGRVLAADVASTVDVPPADNSAMDGFAFRLADLQAASGTLPLSQRIPAGVAPAPLAAGTAARIFTGAEIPPGADTVAMQEDCVYDEKSLTLNACAIDKLKAGSHIRPRGQDMAAGQTVLTRGTRLGPAQAGVLAGAGVASVPVYRRLRVAIFSTGDELLEPGTPAQPGRIYNSNRYALHGWLTQADCSVVDLGVVADTRDATIRALRDAAARADVVITTGGASVGEEDHLRAALLDIGEVDLWKIAIKPGKPLLHGRVTADGLDTPVIGLPGNPVSVAVTFLVMALPFLRALQGCADTVPRALRVPAAFAVKRAGNRTEFLRVRLAPDESGPQLERFANQSSGVLTSMAWADGLARIPADTTVAVGDPVDYLPLAVLFNA